MENLWSDADARDAVARYAEQGVGEDLALRVYSSRLLGCEPRLVLHGGGNTSVKTTASDVLGEPVDVLCVKGSGWDMGDIEPAGLPAVRIDPLRRLIDLETLSDEDMVNAQRINLLDATAPNPSVETLLHAFLPHKFIDHTHANAILALTDQRDGATICKDVYGARAALVPYIMPGFALARKAAEIQRAHPDCEGLILLKHGVFSFGESAEEAYGRMIELVALAEARLGRSPVKVFAGIALPEIAPETEVAPILRGLVAEPVGDDYRRMILDFRVAPEIRDYVDGINLSLYSQQGPVTPDHAIRTKPKALILPPPEAGKLNAWRGFAHAALDAYKSEYRAYFERNNAREGNSKTPLDPVPRVILIPGLGLFGLGASAKAAAIAADLAETTVEVIRDAERLGRFQSIDEADQFEIEYWSLEQAKLGKAAEKPLARHVVAVTGGAGAIGAATAAAFAGAGAEVVLLDLDEGAAAAVAGKVGGLGLACDVTDRAAVARAFERICETHGGLDIVVSNAGAAWQGRIGEVSDETLRQSFELNFFAHQTVAQAAVAVMLAQGTGGCLLFNASKQAVNPGRDFGPYGLPKAATLFLSRQYALDYGSEGIRANAVNADRVRSGLLDAAMIGQRARARGITEADYMARNLLGREVKAEDVARAFLDLALSPKTTGAVLTVDGGNIAAALR